MTSFAAWSIMSSAVGTEDVTDLRGRQRPSPRAPARPSLQPAQHRDAALGRAALGRDLRAQRRGIRSEDWASRTAPRRSRRRACARPWPRSRARAPPAPGLRAGRRRTPAARRHAGDRVEHRFLIAPDDLAGRGEDVIGCVAADRIDGRRRVQAGDAGADQRGRVGHRAQDALVTAEPREMSAMRVPAAIDSTARTSSMMLKSAVQASRISLLSGEHRKGYARKRGGRRLRVQPDVRKTVAKRFAARARARLRRNPLRVGLGDHAADERGGHVAAANEGDFHERSEFGARVQGATRRLRTAKRCGRTPRCAS